MNPTVFRDRIIEKALELGADDAGVCMAGDLLKGPTHRRFALPKGIKDHHCILVIALSHPANEPDLDCFIRREGYRFGNSEGNRRLIDISSRVGQCLTEDGISSRDLHYYVEMGGVFLKDAAALAGLGCIGKNNLFIHPGYGARIRLRAHLVEAPLALSTPLNFDPCTDCEKPCLDTCPARALDEKGYHHERCQAYMDREAAQSPNIPDGGGKTFRKVRYCRICEFSCSFTGTLECSGNRHL